MFYVFGYRKKVVFANLDIAFPEKTLAEKTRIAKKFYKNFIDTFIETIKMLSLSQKQMQKRAVADMSEVHSLIKKGKNIQLHSGHHMNWEYGHWAVASQMPITWIGVYMRINNKAIERLFHKLRSIGNTVLVPAQEFKARTHNVFKQQYAIGLISDQNPGAPASAYWLNFFGTPVSFVTGPDKAARLNNTAVVFVSSVKVKRGYYRFNIDVVEENGKNFVEGELTRLYRDYLETAIRKNPDNYLWSHRRWKWPYLPEYKNRWIDKKPPPIE
jgi:Kdo2-lipid IVA lauroyltransferase/acyltransferase